MYGEVVCTVGCGPHLGVHVWVSYGDSGSNCNYWVWCPKVTMNGIHLLLVNEDQ